MYAPYISSHPLSYPTISDIQTPSAPGKDYDGSVSNIQFSDKVWPHGFRAGLGFRFVSAWDVGFRLRC